MILGLRKKFGDAVGREMVEIASIQTRARKKFGDGVWFATPRAIEQSSDRVVARYKASLAGGNVVVDLCGGIGGDAIAFGIAGGVVTVDRDERMAAMAAENLKTAGAMNAAVVCADAVWYASRIDVANAFIHLDPDRRPQDRRTTSPEAYQPPLDFVVAMIRSSRGAMVKLAPAATLDDDVSDFVHRQWISLAGSVREQTLFAGQAIHLSCDAGGRSAVRLSPDGHVDRYVAPLPWRDMVANVTHEIGDHIIDIDPAIRAAGLSSSFAAAHELSCLGDASGFFTTNDLSRTDPLMRVYRVVWSGAMDERLVRKTIQQLGVKVIAIKVRGTDHEPALLMKCLNAAKTKKHGSAALLIGRHARGIYAVLASPCVPSQPGFDQLH